MAVGLAERPHLWGKAGGMVLACIGVYCLWFSFKAGAFNGGEADRRYVTVARLVRDATPANSIIFSVQHSGSVRYYGSRMSLRYDWLSERWLDRSVAWLTVHGVHPYFLLDEEEISAFRRRFEPQNSLGRLSVARVWEYRGSPNVYLWIHWFYPTARRKIAIFTPADIMRPNCVEPASRPRLLQELNQGTSPLGTALKVWVPLKSLSQSRQRR